MNEKDFTSEKVFRSVIENSIDLTIITDAEGVVSYVSPQCNDVIGYKEEDIIGKIMPDFIHPDDKEKCRQAWEKVMAGDTLREFNYRIFDKDGKLRWLSHLAKYVTENKITVGMQNIIRDITKQILERENHRIEREIVIELSATSDFNHALSCILKAALCIEGIDCGGIYVVDENELEAKLVAYEGLSNQFVDKTSYFGKESQQMEMVRAGQCVYANASVLPSAVREDLELENLKSLAVIPIKHKGKVVAVMNLASRSDIPPFSRTGIEDIAGHIGDAIVRVKMEDALRASEGKSKALLNAPDETLLLLDLEGRIICINSKGAERFNRTPEEMEGENIYEYTPSELTHHRRKLIEDVFNTGEPIHFEDNREGFHFLNSVYPVFNNKQKNVEMVAVYVSDITVRKRAQEELEKAQKLESLGILAGGIAHDFNNLLAGLFGFIDLARDSIHNDRTAKEYLESGMQCFSRAKDLTHQLLTFAKGGAPQKEPISIERILQESIKLSLSGSNISCEKDIQQNLHLIEADHGQMNQVFNNVLINARQAMPSGGKVKVQCYNRDIQEGELADMSAGAYVNFILQDQGTGIPPDLLQKIFDPFFTTKQAGSGLGLATSYSIIRKHNGRITIESELGKGTTVSIMLPAILDEEQEKTIETEALFRGTGKILLMDDEEVIRDFTHKILRCTGFDVSSARNGEEAISLYEDSLKSNTKFIVVILDLTVIGGMGGEQTVRRLLEIDPNAKAIASSGYSDSPILANPREYGFLGKIAKPYQRAELLKVISEVLKTKNGTG